MVIFDCDGVLVDSEMLSCQCLSEVLGEFGIELSRDDALELFLGRSATAILQHYEGDRRFIPENFLATLKARVLQRFRHSLRPILGVGSLVSSLKMPFCVASSSDLDRVSLSLWGFTGGSHYQSGGRRSLLRDAGADRVFDRKADFWSEG